MDEAQTRKRLEHLRHPGQLSTIRGRQVKREAFRYVIVGAALHPGGVRREGAHYVTDEDAYAYSADDAVAILHA